MKVIAATNRVDILDPALLRFGRLDRKIEFPVPNDTARLCILQIHSRKMSTSSDVNYEKLARSTDEFNDAQLKAVCVEADMIALTRSESQQPTTAITTTRFISLASSAYLDDDLSPLTFSPPSLVLFNLLFNPQSRDNSPLSPFNLLSFGSTSTLKISYPNASPIIV
jgi:SpoVK/Ycf46/Vps4 family AAA+-type ATPase